MKNVVNWLPRWPGQRAAGLCGRSLCSAASAVCGQATSLKIKILPAAKADLINIGDYIALDNPNRALSFVAEIEDVITDSSRLRGFACKNPINGSREAAKPRRRVVANIIPMA